MSITTAATKVLAQLQQPLWVFDFDRGRVVWANESALEIWNASSKEELYSREMSAEMSPAVATRLRQYQADFCRDEGAFFSETWTLFPNGKPRTLQVVFNPFELPDGRMATLIEAMAGAELSPDGLRSSEALLHTPVMISLFDESGTVLYRNPAARDSVPCHAQSLQQRFVEQGDVDRMMHELARWSTSSLTASCVTVRGERWHEITARKSIDAITGRRAWLVSEVDVERLKNAEERAQFLAHHDALTKLPNRYYVNRAFGELLEDCANAGIEAAMIFVDLDHFKTINDTLGHAAGDQLLVEVAARLERVVGDEGQVARLGGDEFVVLVASADARYLSGAVTAKISLSLASPMQILEREIRITPTMGVSVYPADGETIDELMRSADLAVYEAKSNGRNVVVYYTPELNRAAQSRMQLESELKLAFEQGQFVTHFQPRVRTRDGRITGAEALVRWRHPQRGLVYPGEFIALCEELGYIGELGMLVFADAVRQQVRWQRLGFPLRVSVNVSARQFRSETLVDELCAIVEQFGARAEYFELEITESTLLGNDESTVRVLTELKREGFRIALDDFGTGYSNLAYLQKYRLDCIKIDRSFIAALETSEPLAEIVVAIGGWLDLDVVAEGVETEAQRRWLEQRDCVEFQGYLFSKPLPAEELTALLHRASSDTDARAKESLAV